MPVSVVRMREWLWARRIMRPGRAGPGAFREKRMCRGGGGGGGGLSVPGAPGPGGGGLGKPDAEPTGGVIGLYTPPPGQRIAAAIPWAS